jgi:hypothetical protein
MQHDPMTQYWEARAFIRRHNKNLQRVTKIIITNKNDFDIINLPRIHAFSTPIFDGIHNATSHSGPPRQEPGASSTWSSRRNSLQHEGYSSWSTTILQFQGPRQALATVFDTGGHNNGMRVSIASQRKRPNLSNHRVEWQTKLCINRRKRLPVKSVLFDRGLRKRGYILPTPLSVAWSSNPTSFDGVYGKFVFIRWELLRKKLKNHVTDLQYSIWCTVCERDCYDSSSYY